MKKQRCDTKWPVYKIERKKGVRFYAVYSPTNGKQVTKTLKTKNEAILWLKQQHSVTAAIQRGERSHENCQQTVKWLCQYWMENYCLLYKAKASIRSDAIKIDVHINPEFGSLKLLELNSKMIEEWMAKLRQKLAPKSCNNVLGLFQKILNDAKRWKFIETNPAVGIPRFKVPERDFKCWTPQEKVKFLRYVHRSRPEEYPLFLTALSTGLRLGELRGLQWHCIDFENSTLTAKQAYCYASKELVSHTKSFKIRRLPLNKQLLACLSAERAKATSQNVFEGLTVFKQPSYKVRKRCKWAGVPEIRFHDLRHVFASHLAMSGVSLYDLQKLMGHQSVTMTERYSHLIPDSLNGLTEALTVPMISEDLAGPSEASGQTN